MPIFNALKYRDIVSLATGEADKQHTLTGLEQTFLLNLVANIPWTESQACHAIWADKASLTASEKDAAGALIDGAIHKLMVEQDNCQAEIDALNAQISILQSQIAQMENDMSVCLDYIQNTIYPELHAIYKKYYPDPVLELKFNQNVYTDLAGTIPAGLNDYVRAWRSNVNGVNTLFTQSTDAARPQRQSDGLYFDGGDKLTGGFAMATRSPWTIEFWQYDTNISNTVAMVTIAPSPARLYIEWVDSTFYIGDAATNAIALATTRPLNTWYHTAASFDGSTYRLFRDGLLLTSSNTVLISATSSQIWIGDRIDTSSFYLGKLTDIRIYTSAKYTANFTPPTRSA